MSSKSTGSNADKMPYRSPTLVRYGKVKELTGANSGTRAGDSNTMMSSGSDRHIKENIARVGDHPAGFGLYLFDYKPEFAYNGAGRQFGVMADEVELIVPEAVSVGDHGYRVVDYSRLGIVRH